MQPKNHRIPLTGPVSNPVIYGVAQGLKLLFPPVELTPARNNTSEAIEEAATIKGDPNEQST